MALGIPVVFIVFNRPDLTRESFARIRDQRPERLFIVADGPRDGHSSDRGRCAEVRRIVAGVDWPCEVRREYAENNLGCKRRVSSGLDWVFLQVDRAIILEDDCVAHPDFFRFCDELLDRYADDPSVAMVTGDNFQGGVWRGDASYYFSRYPHIWGWATWRRAWARYDGDIAFWSAWQESEDWEMLIPDRVERRYWERIFDRVAVGGVDAWAYPWTASTWYHGGLTATPNVNLVVNIGFGPDATHTNSARPESWGDTSPIGEIRHPEDGRVNAVADSCTFDHHFGGSELRSRKRPAGFVKWFVPGVTRFIKRRLSLLLARSAEQRERGEAGDLQ